MEFLDSTYFGNTVLNWLIAAGIMIGVAGILRVLVGWVLVWLKKWADRTNSQIDDLVIKLLTVPEVSRIMCGCLFSTRLGTVIARLAGSSS